MLLDQGRLVVVQGDPAQLSFLKLRDGARPARIKRTQTSDKLRGPSTVDRAKGLYLVVNADFATSTKPFTVAGLPRKAKHHGHDDHGHGLTNGHGHDEPRRPRSRRLGPESAFLLGAPPGSSAGAPLLLACGVELARRGSGSAVGPGAGGGAREIRPGRHTSFGTWPAAAAGPSARAWQRGATGVGGER